jgi:hypothetical protein
MKQLLLFALVLLSMNTFAQDCSKFKTGKFKYSDATLGDVIVVRDKAGQIEKNAKTNTEIHGSIDWVTDCKYILTFKKVVNADIPEIIGKQIAVEIIETHGNKYKCRVTDNNGFDGVLEVIKIE